MNKTFISARSILLLLLLLAIAFVAYSVFIVS